MVNNRTWSGAYLSRTLYISIFQKILTLVPLAATVPEVYITTLYTVIYDYYDDLGETLNHLKIIKLKRYFGENISDLRAKILVEYELLESAGALDTNQLGYITRIFENSSDSR